MGKSWLRFMAVVAALLIGLCGMGKEWLALEPGRMLPVVQAAAGQAPPGMTSIDTAHNDDTGAMETKAADPAYGKVTEAAASKVSDSQLLAAVQKAQESRSAAASEGKKDEEKASHGSKNSIAAGGKIDRPTVYLTFDDGPSIYTGQVLDILKKNGIKATFFMVGEHIKEHPELVRRVKEEGHSIGNHSYDHVYSEIYGSFAGYADQTLRTEQELLRVGVATNLVRAPGGTYGNFDAGYFDAMNKAGYKMVDWNVDSGDSKRVGVPAKEIVAGVESAPLKQEMTVLLHDGTGHIESVKALPAIIAFYKDKGYSFAAVTPSAPVPQFPVAKELKWKRAAPKPAETAEFTAASDRLRKDELWLAASSGNESSAAAMAAAGAVNNAEGPAAGNPQGAGEGVDSTGAGLIIHSSHGDVLLADADYSINKGRLAVPVRRVIEALGGSVQWDKAVGSARIYSTTHSGGSLLTGDVFQQPQGTLRAPLTELLRQLGQQLVRVSSISGTVEVWTDTAPEETVGGVRTAV